MFHNFLKLSTQHRHLMRSNSDSKIRLILIQNNNGENVFNQSYCSLNKKKYKLKQVDILTKRNIN